MPSDREILHAIVREFIVDEQEGIAEPLGMQGSRLEAAVHLVTGNQTRSKTVLTCINRAGIEAAEMVFEPLATAEAVMTHDERELGSLLVDVGSGTTEYALFIDGEVFVSAVLPIGSSHFTNDIAMVLRTPFARQSGSRCSTAVAWTVCSAPRRAFRFPPWQAVRREWCRRRSCARSCSHGPRRCSP